MTTDEEFRQEKNVAVEIERMHMALVAACGAFRLKHMWLDTVVSSFALVRDLSWTLSCPPHCGSGLLVPLLAGFSLGSLVTLLLVAWILLSFGFRLPDLSPAPSAPINRSRRRLDGYLLHEQ